MNVWTRNPDPLEELYTMAVMIIGGERYTNVPVWLKGRLLTDTVETTKDIAVLSVESGSEAGKRYSVRHDSVRALSCDCPARVDCCHMMAVERYLALASDTQAHLDDMGEDEDEDEMGECEARAREIIEQERDAQVRAEVAALPDADSSAMAEVYAMQAEKARKLAAQAAYREAYPDDFCDYYGAA